MPYAHDLLDLAQQLADMSPEAPQQASLRRGISTAYYAIFHLLIGDATANWGRPELRAALSRCFDHGPMRSASEARISDINRRLKTKAADSAEVTIATHLRSVASAFVLAQQWRNDADYNLAREWTRVEATERINFIQKAFESWSIIREESAAQAYLVSLLGARERRPGEFTLPPGTASA